MTLKRSFLNGATYLNYTEFYVITYSFSVLSMKELLIECYCANHFEYKYYSTFFLFKYFDFSVNR